MTVQPRFLHWGQIKPEHQYVVLHTGENVFLRLCYCDLLTLIQISQGVVYLALTTSARYYTECHWARKIIKISGYLAKALRALLKAKRLHEVLGCYHKYEVFKSYNAVSKCWHIFREWNKCIYYILVSAIVCFTWNMLQHISQCSILSHAACAIFRAKRKWCGNHTHLARSIIVPVRFGAHPTFPQINHISESDARLFPPQQHQWKWGPGVPQWNHGRDAELFLVEWVKRWLLVSF